MARYICFRYASAFDEVPLILARVGAMKGKGCGTRARSSLRYKRATDPQAPILSTKSSHKQETAIDLTKMSDNKQFFDTITKVSPLVQ